MIPYGRQTIGEDDVTAVADAVRGDWLTQGPTVRRFEEALAAATGAPHVVAFANGTAALHGAVAAAGVRPGDVVVTSALSFVASAACARYVGATPAFADIDPATLNLDPAQVAEGASAVVVVHFAGLPAPLPTGSRRPPVVIEDAAHALGASTPDGPVGSCARSDMCVFSFHPVKAITTGEGGAVTTGSAELAERLRRFRNHGIVHRPERGGWYYEIAELGFNYRMTDLQAALGISQLAKLGRFVERRNQLAERYHRLLADLPVELPPAAPPGHRHAYHLFPVQVSNRRAVYERMRNAGIGVQVHYVPIHRHPLYADLAPAEGLPATDAAYERLLSIPLYPALEESQQDRVVDVLKASL